MCMRNKAITLLEFILGIILFSSIILAAVSFDLVSGRLLKITEQETVVLNEMTGVLDHIQKHLDRVSGDLNNPGIVFTPTDPGDCLLPSATACSVHFRQQDMTPENYLDDPWVTYTYEYATHTLKFCHPRTGISLPCTSIEDVLSDRVRFDPTLSVPHGFLGSLYVDGASNMIPNDFVVLLIALRYNPNIPMDALGNPEITLYDDVHFVTGSYSVR